MITERIKISNDGTGMKNALGLAEALAVSLGLSKKESFHLRLLAEEMFSMVRAIAGNFSANFWIEEEKRLCRLHLEASKMDLDYGKRRELLSVSTEGKNTARRGIMEKVREVVEAGLYAVAEGYNIQAEYGIGMFNYGAMGIQDTVMSETLYAWSMQKYKSEIESRPDKSEALDEIEKSIIANIADDVRVGVRKDSLEILVQKKF